MPELPEVESIRRTLEPHIRSAVLKKIEILHPAVFVSRIPDLLPEHLHGEVVRGLTRRGKYLLLHLSGSHILIMHMRMTGKLLYVPADTCNQAEEGAERSTERDACEISMKHVHLYFDFCLPNGAEGRVLFQDVRRFGRVECIRTQDLQASGRGVAALGPEPLSAKYNVDHLWAECKAHPALAIKGLLLRQESVAGIGNIYADEILYAAGVRPGRKVRTVRRYEIARIVAETKRILKAAIQAGGTTFRDYADADRQRGRYVRSLQVYQRGGLPCYRCSTRLQRVKVAGRGTVFCPHCQPAAAHTKLPE